MRFRTIYAAILYGVVGLLALINALALSSGHAMSLVPLLPQVAVLVAVALKKPWAHVVVIAWGALGIVSGLAMWLAVLLRGGVFSQTPAVTVFRTAILGLCVFFVVFAKRALSAASVPAADPS